MEIWYSDCHCLKGLAGINMDEWRTRKQLVDLKLRVAGWDVAPFGPGSSFRELDRCAGKEYPTTNGPADYALASGANYSSRISLRKK